MPVTDGEVAAEFGIDGTVVSASRFTPAGAAFAAICASCAETFIAANAETENRNIINCLENFIIWIAPDKFGRINISLKNSNAYYVAAEVIVSSI
jgi:hypothetical protein